MPPRFTNCTLFEDLHYYKQRFYNLLDTIQDANSDAALPEWQQLVEECAHDAATEEAIFQAAFQDDRISTVAKTWLRRVHHKR